MIRQIEFELPACTKGFHLVTSKILSRLGPLPDKGLLHIFLKHTSAALAINENADPSVRSDLESYMEQLVPESSSRYEHSLEGPDDMPAHIQSSLFGQSLTIPVTNGHPNLGTWQGIYLCEFRNDGGPRSLVVTVFG